MGVVGNITTVLTLTARIGCHSPLSVRTDAIQALGNNTGRTGLTDTTNARQHIGMSQSIRCDSIGNCADKSILTNQVRKDLRAIFSCQYMRCARHIKILKLSGRHTTRHKEIGLLPSGPDPLISSFVRGLPELIIPAFPKKVKQKYRLVQKECSDSSDMETEITMTD